MRTIRFAPWLTLGASITVLIAVVAVVFYINRAGDDGEGDLDEYFLRDARAMQEMGLPVYWLGREFSAGDLVFRGPEVAEFGAEVQGGGIDMSYLLEGGNSALDLATYSRDAWARVEDRMMNPRTPGASRRSVSVLEKDADMFSAPGGTRPLNALWLVIDLDDVVVVADTNSGGATYPGGPDYNPFINNPDLLVQVMENLRPYPE